MESKRSAPAPAKEPENSKKRKDAVVRPPTVKASAKSMGSG